MTTGAERVVGYDFIRTFAILTVFLGHIATPQAPQSILAFVTRTLSPDLTMSLLGFTSAILLTPRSDVDAGAFLVRRLLRIYVSLFICLTIASGYLTLTGHGVWNQHSIVHYLGLTSAFLLADATSRSPLGGGLWFVSTILALYLLLPALKRLFSHPNGLWHLALVLILCVTAQSVMWSMESTWNVVAAFCIGVTVALRGMAPKWEKPATILPALFGAALLLALAGAVAADSLPSRIGTLIMPLYPVAFVPLFFWLASRTPRPMTRAIVFFSALSYEFYILHAYFIGSYLQQALPAAETPAQQVAAGFLVTLAAAWPASIVAVRLRQALEQYLLRIAT